jgi:hypothetical protein
MSTQPSTDADYKGREKDRGRESRLSFRNFAEHQMRRELKEKAMVTCDPQVKNFAECSQKKGLMVVWSCHSLFQKVNDCLSLHNGEEAWEKYKTDNQEELDRRSTGKK